MSFHINPTTGRPGACRATTGRCPFGGEADHFDTVQEARSGYEAMMTDAVFSHRLAKDSRSSSSTASSSNRIEGVEPSLVTAEPGDSTEDLVRKQKFAERLSYSGDNETFLRASSLALTLQAEINERSGKSAVYQPYLAPSGVVGEASGESIRLTAMPKAHFALAPSTLVGEPILRDSSVRAAVANLSKTPALV